MSALLGKKKFEELLGGLIYKPPGKPALVPESDKRPAMNTAIEDFNEYYGQDFPYDEYKKEASALFHSRYGNGKLPLKSGVKELLSYLKENGYLVGLASSTRQAIVEREIRDAGLMPYFDNLVCGDMLKRSKPEPDIYLKACENLDVEPRMAARAGRASDHGE